MLKSLVALACVFSFAASAAKAEDWTQNSFEEFRHGTFTDAGSNAYVSARGRIQIINRWDLNNDGFLDVIMPAGHGQTEKEDTYLYLNNGGDIDARLLVRVPANGSMDGVVRDLNKDGINDLAVCNGDNGIHQRTDTYVYYGTKDGFTASKRVTLPSHDNTGICAGDFDGDGLLDLAIASRYRKGPIQNLEEKEISFIYWNSDEGFKPDNRTEFSFNDRGATGVVAGDLDGDGKDDLIMLADKTYIYYGKDGSAKDHSKKPVELATTGTDAAIGDVDKDGIKDLALCMGEEVRVLRGVNGGGFDVDKPIVLKGDNANDVALADFDGDGMDDVAVANFGNGNEAQKSFVYYSDGKAFTGRDKLELPTFGAVAISAGDINGDGKPEIVVSNQRINYYHALQSAVFWNKDGKFSFGDRTQLDTQGCTSNCIGDVNNDGKPDVVFFNLEGFYRDGPAYTRVYWGDGTRNYTPLRALDIVPTHYVTGVGHADLDDDGDVELIINQGRYMNGIPYDNAVPTVIVWNSPEGLSTRSNLTMESPSGGGTKILDFNRDGYLDMLIGGTVKTDDDKLSMPIFLGSATGFHHKDKMTVPLPAGTKALRVALAMDLNKDGFIDIAASAAPGKVRVFFGSADGYSDSRVADIDLGRKDELMYINAADLNKDGWLDMIMPCRQIGPDSEVTSFVYFGSANGFSNDSRIEIPSAGPYDLSVADFDKDGWLDVFLNSYKGNETRNKPSYIYWGSPEGLLKRPRQEIPTYASSGAETADFDGDGWIDIYSANHRKDGFTDKPGPHRHQTDSMIYWGGKEGFSPERRLLIPSYGPHPVNIRDVGNSYDRGLYEDYVASAHEISSGQAPAQISWNAETPLKTSVKFQVRVAETQDALLSAAWSGPKGKDDWFATSGSKIEGAGGKWIQYRARLITPNGGATPYLSSVTISFK